MHKTLTTQKNSRTQKRRAHSVRTPHDSRGCMGGAFQPHTQEVGVCKATLYYCKSGTNECFKIGIYLKKPE